MVDSTFHKPPHTVCGHCHGAMPKAHAVSGGVAYCQRCYWRVFKKVPCESCGKSTKSPFGHKPATCRACRLANRLCVRCAKPVQQAGKLVPEGAVCPSCAKYFHEPKACPVCGHVSHRLARDFKNGYREPVCERCRRKNFVTCAECGKHRRAVSVNHAGKPICPTCAERQGAPFICPTCGRPGRRHSKARCERCYWNERVGKRFLELETRLAQAWVRKEFSRFFDELFDYYSGKIIALRLARYAEFFAAIDKYFTQRAELSYRGLVQRLGRSLVHDNTVAVNFFIKHGLVEELPSWEHQAVKESTTQVKLLEQAASKPYHSVLTAFHRSLVDVSERYQQRGWTRGKHRPKPRTITVSLQAAQTFLDFLPAEGVANLRQLNQVDLDRFLERYPGYANALRTFLLFLHRVVKLFRPISIPTTPKRAALAIALGPERKQELLTKWLTSEGSASQEGLICSLMLLYAQMPHRIVQIKLSDLQRSEEGRYSVIFGRVDLPLSEEIGRLLDHYLAYRDSKSPQERPWENEYLFPGKMIGTHLSPAAITYYLKKNKVTAKALFATAVANAYRHGVRHPKILVNALGICTVTAVKYMNEFDPRLVDEVTQKLRSHG